GLGDLGEGHLGVQRVVQRRHRATRELDVHDGADDPHDPAGGPGPGRAVLRHCCGHCQSLPALVDSASAPPTISLISWVICACRAWLASRERTLTRSVALSVAAFMAVRRAADS